jgi:hypothetical protein
LLSFRRIKREDRNAMTACLSKIKTRMCESAYSTYFLWDEKYRFEIDFSDGFLFVRYTEDGERGYLIPAGEGDFVAALDKLIAYCEANREPLRLGYVPESFMQMIQDNYPNEFEFTEDRDSSEYLYLSEKMISLSGKKLHGKRNFVNRFKKSFDGRWSFEHITPDNIKEVMAYDRHWYRDNRSSEGDLEAERVVIHKLLDNMDYLGSVGGALRLDGKIIGFSLGTEICDDTFDVQIEKAEWEIPGAYQMLTNQFAKEFCSKYTYINREEDMGLEGLRKSKLSYYPYKILMKYTGVRKVVSYRMMDVGHSCLSNRE